MHYKKNRTISLDYLGIKNSKINYQLSADQLHNETFNFTSFCCQS